VFNDNFDNLTARALDPLSLAFVGDGVHTLYVRTRLAEKIACGAGALHKAAKKHVSAAGQSLAYGAVRDVLTDAESDICRRARNRHNNTVAKNADLATYKAATSFEALLGFLYLTGDDDRLNGILDKAFAVIADGLSGE
jgi:ribonuclease-3 family protein